MLVIICLALQISCYPSKKPKTVPGGPIKINKADEIHIRQLLKDYLKNLQTGNNPELILKKILSGTKQVVVGIRYVVVVLLHQGSNKIECELTIWERDWLPAPDNLSIKSKCGNGVKL